MAPDGSVGSTRSTVSPVTLLPVLVYPSMLDEYSVVCSNERFAKYHARDKSKFFAYNGLRFGFGPVTVHPDVVRVGAPNAAPRTL